MLSDDRTHAPKSDPDVAHLFQLGGNSMYISVHNYTLEKSEDFFTSAGQLPLCKTKCPLPCVGKLM